MDDRAWFDMTIKARDIEVEDRKTNFDRARPPLPVGVDQRMVRWAYNRIEDLEVAVAALQGALATLAGKPVQQDAPKQARQAK